jgi:hypothetical protein
MTTLIKQKIFVIIGLIITLTAILSLISILSYNCIKGSDETTVMGACFYGEKVANYEVNGPENCPPIELNNDFPLRVCTFTNTDVIDPIKASNHAINFINDNLGYEAFTFSCEDFDVFAVLGLAKEKTWNDELGTAWHEKNDNGDMRGYVETFNTGDDQTLNRVLIHEFLHILGLGHDDWPGSIMFPVTLNYENEISIGTLWISDADRKYLQRYRPYAR